LVNRNVKNLFKVLYHIFLNLLNLVQEILHNQQKYD